MHILFVEVTGWGLIAEVVYLCEQLHLGVLRDRIEDWTFSLMVRLVRVGTRRSTFLFLFEYLVAYRHFFCFGQCEASKSLPPVEHLAVLPAARRQLFGLQNHFD